MLHIVFGKVVKWVFTWAANTIVGFLSGAILVLLIGQQAVVFKVNIQHYWPCSLKTSKQDSLSLFLTYSGIWGNSAPDIYQQCCAVLLSHPLSAPTVV